MFRTVSWNTGNQLIDHLQDYQLHRDSFGGTKALSHKLMFLDKVF